MMTGNNNVVRINCTYNGFDGVCVSETRVYDSLLFKNYHSREAYSPKRSFTGLFVLLTVYKMAAPKFDFKMLVVPAILFFSKKLDMTDPAILQMVRTGFISG